MTLLPVSPRRQQQQADCLAACAAMVLDYLRVPVAYNRLLRLLRVDPIGAPFRNLRYLESARLPLQVHIASGDMAALSAFLQRRLPVIVAVDTAELPYWQEATDHAVLVVGLDETWVYLLDPDIGDSPLPVSLAEFELAWLQKDYLYAVIEKTD